MTEQTKTFEAIQLQDGTAEVGYTYSDGEYYTLAVVGWPERAGNLEDAQKIATAITHYDELVAALEIARRSLNSFGELGFDVHDDVSTIENALAKARTA